jgi:transcriptional regulator of arginine metabolism
MPHELELKERRHREILTLLRRGRVRGQAQLVALLERRGIEATQSSVSRDLRELGVAKVAGRYVAPPAAPERDPQASPPPPRSFAACAAGPHLAVVLTVEGAAQTVGLALDRAGWPRSGGHHRRRRHRLRRHRRARDQQRLLQRLDALLLETTP